MHGGSSVVLVHSIHSNARGAFSRCRSLPFCLYSSHLHRILFYNKMV